VCGTGCFEAVERVVGVVLGGLADVVDGGGSRGERERDGDVALTALEEGFQFCCRQPLNLAQTGVAVGVVAVEDADVAAAVEHHVAGLPVDVFVGCGQRESQRPPDFEVAVGVEAYGDGALPEFFHEGVGGCIAGECHGVGDAVDGDIHSLRIDGCGVGRSLGLCLVGSRTGGKEHCCH